MGPITSVVMGFSSPYDALVEPGGTVEIKRDINRVFRLERLEIRPRSALAFDLISGQLGPRILVEGGAPISLAVLPSAPGIFKSAPRVLALPSITLTVASSGIKATVRNVSDKPARFCANLVGVGEMVP